MKASWRTTVTGILTIIIAVASAALSFLKTGTLPDWGILSAAVVSGVGLITARDANVTSEQQGIK